MKPQNCFGPVRRRSLGALLAAACAVPALTGCLNERLYTDPSANMGGATSALNLSPGDVRGDFGPYRGINGPATDVTGDSDSGLGASTVAGPLIPR